MLRRLATLVAVILIVAPSVFAQSAPDRPRSVIMMIPDGFGPASLTFARMASGEALALDTFLTGSVGTSSADRHITDSAASATAYAAGIRTYNGAIAVDTDGLPVGTVLQGARELGKSTGLVTTTEITHATPAAFAAHVESRAMASAIASQLIDNRVDLMLGGGRIYFLPEPDGRRDDGRNLLEEAAAAGYSVLVDPAGLDEAQLPVLGLFADSHLAYEIDRHRTNEPSLADLTRRALDLLADNPNGFFLMIEGGRIDHAGHGNDAAGHLFDILAYDEAVRVALDFAAEDGHTLVVSAADHETGGLTIGRDGSYAFDPDYLLGTSASGAWMAEEARRRADGAASAVSSTILGEVVVEYSPIEELTEVEMAMLEQAAAATVSREPGRTMAYVVGRRAGIGWTTTGHTGVDATLHAFGPGSERLTGFLDNDEVGRIIAELLGVDLGAVTERVRASMGIEAASSDIE